MRAHKKIWKRVKKILICGSGNADRDDPAAPPMVPLASARATDTMFRRPLPVAKKSAKRRQEERPKSARSFSSTFTLRLSPFVWKYEENREKEEIARSILHEILDGFIPDEIPSVTRPWSASTVNTVVSEMTIPSPAQTPREEAEPKTIWQKIAAWPVLGLRRVSPSVWESPRPGSGISPTSIESTEL